MFLCNSTIEVEHLHVLKTGRYSLYTSIRSQFILHLFLSEKVEQKGFQYNKKIHNEVKSCCI